MYFLVTGTYNNMLEEIFLVFNEGASQAIESCKSRIIIQEGYYWEAKEFTLPDRTQPVKFLGYVDLT